MIQAALAIERREYVRWLTKALRSNIWAVLKKSVPLKRRRRS